MVAKEITSLQHPLVKEAVRLRLNRKEREQSGHILLSGKKMILDLAATYPIDTLFFTETPTNQLRAKTVFRVSSEVLKKICGLEEKEGLAAIVPMPAPQSLSEKTHLLILDQISDPGNLGTLWRTALALGWGGIWLTPGTVDPFNDKALRAAKGATFHLPYERVTPSQVKQWLNTKKATLFTADLEGTPLFDVDFKTEPLALLLSNEGKGPSNWSSSFSKKVTIPMTGTIESLNVASAGAIFLYAMRPF